MSLLALPVTAAELMTLQAGIQFSTNAVEANQKAVFINVLLESVFTYAAELLKANVSLSQAALAVDALMAGATPSIEELSNISTNFLPAQVAHAVKFGFNPTVYAAETVGLALAGGASFNANFVGLGTSEFVAAVANNTGVNTGAIGTWLANWTAFYTANPDATFGLTIAQAARGATFGDAVGVALLNPTSANLQTVFSTTFGPNSPQFEPNTVKGVIANALIDIAEGSYKAGVPLGSLPPHLLLEGEAGLPGALQPPGFAGGDEQAGAPGVSLIGLVSDATSGVHWVT
jgi:hypothetical protein